MNMDAFRTNQEKTRLLFCTGVGANVLIQVYVYVQGTPLLTMEGTNSLSCSADSI